MSLILGLERSPGEGNGNPLQCSCLGNPMDRGAWRATVHLWGCTELDMTELASMPKGQWGPESLKGGLIHFVAMYTGLNSVPLKLMPTQNPRVSNRSLQMNLDQSGWRWALNPKTGSLIGRACEDTDVHTGRMPCADRGGDWSDVSICQEATRIASNQQQLGERHRMSQMLQKEPVSLILWFEVWLPGLWKSTFLLF